jgi:hypothetical protein
MDRDRLIAEIASEHGIRLDQEDPIVVAAMINERLLEEAAAALRRSITAAADQLSAASVQHLEAAKNSAAALMTDAGAWVAERLKAAGAEASAAVLAQLRQETAKAERASHTAVRAAWVTAAIAALTLAGMAGFWFAGLGHG